MSTADIKKYIKNHPFFKASRLVSLYSNFDKLKVLNNEGYEANLRAWEQLILDLTREGILSSSRLCFSTFNPDLTDVLSLPENGKPGSIPTVIEELVNKEKVIPLSWFMKKYGDLNSQPNNSLLSFVSPLKFVRWGLSALSNESYRAKDEHGHLIKETYIILDQLIHTSDSCFNLLQENLTNNCSFSDRLFNEDMLYNYLRERIYIDRSDLKLILIYWSQHETKRCNVHVKNDKTYIKFDQEKIKDEDVSVIDLKASLFALNQRNYELENKIVDLDSILHETMKQNEKKESLIHYIALKKSFKSSLNKSLNAVTQLSEIMNRLNDAALNKELYEMLSSGSKLLKDMNSKIDINDVDILKTELDDEIAKTNEIQNALTEGRSDYDVDEELNRLYDEMHKSPKHSSCNESDDVVDNEGLLSRLNNLRIDTPDHNKGQKPAVEAELAT